MGRGVRCGETRSGVPLSDSPRGGDNSCAHEIAPEGHHKNMWDSVPPPPGNLMRGVSENGTPVSVFTNKGAYQRRDLASREEVVPPGVHMQGQRKRPCTQDT